MRNRKQMIALVLLAVGSVLAAAPTPRQTASVVLVTTDGLRGQEIFTAAVEEPARAFWRGETDDWAHAGRYDPYLKEFR
jgi:hypothetical protein